ncbi:uncharacterized protein LOC126987606 [Eriocheir sinensis]|uniref:uncharacterized protein LOC126987606 n=1 Tax=Eriocheir sinensis TaxID=95602 RepID=UPI0021C9C827|nr:uncharacterized protein LOC126987606 [Eriocheir sinensis]
MAGNCTNKLSEEALLHFSVVYIVFICIGGIICNVVALWCVARCQRTITPVKVILGAIFSCTLLLCLVELPFMAHLNLVILRCDKIPTMVMEGVLISCLVLSNMELFYISIMAFLRARAVWAPLRGPVTLRRAVAVVVGAGFYFLFVTMVSQASQWMELVNVNYVLTRVYCVVHFFLPVLCTIVCYLSTIVAVRRNKRNLPVGHHTAAVTQVTDEATRAMLAVFLSNLVLSFPYSIHYIQPVSYSFTIRVVITMVYFTRLFVDPLVFVCFNRHHRRHVLQGLKLCLGRNPREEGESPYTQSSSALGVTTRGEAKPQGNTC